MSPSQNSLKCRYCSHIDILSSISISVESKDIQALTFRKLLSAVLGAAVNLPSSLCSEATRALTPEGDMLLTLLINRIIHRN
jgi:hypothetical protein